MEQPQTKKKSTVTKVPNEKNKLKRLADAKLMSPKPTKSVCVDIPLLSQSGTSKSLNNMSKRFDHFIKHLKLLIKKEILESVNKNDQSLNHKVITNFSKKADLLMNNLKKKLVKDQKNKNNFLEDQVEKLEKNKADLENKLLRAESMMTNQMNKFEEKLNNLSNNKNKLQRESTNTSRKVSILNNKNYEINSYGFSEANKPDSESFTTSELNLAPESDTTSFQVLKSSSHIRQDSHTSNEKVSDNTYFEDFSFSQQLGLNNFIDEEDDLQSEKDDSFTEDEEDELQSEEDDSFTEGENSTEETHSNLPSFDMTNNELVENETNNSSTLKSTRCKYCVELILYKWKAENNKTVCQPEQFYRKLLQQHNCLPTKVYCEKCGQLSNWSSSSKLWRCNKSINKIRCSFKMSEKLNTFFAGTQIRYEQLVMFFSEFTKETFSVENALSKAEFSYHSMLHWWKKCCKVCANALENERIGGYGRTVEIDDNLFLFNNDARKNRNPITCRVFGGVDTESLNSFVVYLSDENRNCSSLESLIVKHVSPGTTICYKRKKGYKNISSLRSSQGYSMNYSANTSSHYNLCEQLWEDLKCNVRRKGLHSTGVENYINRYMFYRKHPENTLHNFLLQISLSFPLSRVN